MSWKTLSQAIVDGDLPSQLIKDMPMECRCGYDFIISDNLKKFRCMNPVCPEHMAERILSVTRKLGVKGFGIKSAQKYADSGKIDCPAQIIPILFKDSKPVCHLWEVARYCGIEGIDGNWQVLMEGVRNKEEAYAKLPPHLHAYVNTIFESAKYFDVKIPHHKTTVHITIHGDITHFSNRESWVNELNRIDCNLVNTVLKTSVTNTVSYVVTEQPGDTGCSKLKKAKEKRVPIISPQQYVDYLAEITGKMLASY